MPFDGIPSSLPTRSTVQDRFSYDEHFHYVDQPNLKREDNIFFARELEHIIPEQFRHTPARINARRVFPIDRSAAPTAKSITWRQFQGSGRAQIIADYAGDVNLVNVDGVEFTTGVRGIAVGAMWSIDEIRAARAHNRPLDRMQALEAREAMLREENRIAFLGDAAFNVQGLFSAGTGIPQNPAPTGGWTGATAADLIFADLNFGANTIPETTGDIEAPTTLLLPTSKYNLIVSRKHGVDSDRTIASLFTLNNPYVSEIIPVRELETAGAGGTPVAVFYERSPQKIRMQVPLDIEQFAPMQKNLSTLVLWHMKVGGLTIHKPASIHIMTGI